MTKDFGKKRMDDIIRIEELTGMRPSHILYGIEPPVLGTWFGMATHDDDETRMHYTVGETDPRCIPGSVTIEGVVNMAILSKFELLSKSKQFKDSYTCWVVDFGNNDIYEKGDRVRAGREEVEEMGYNIKDINMSGLPEEIRNKLKMSGLYPNIPRDLLEFYGL